MKINFPSLYIEINLFEFIFIVVNTDDNDDYKIIHINSIPIQGIADHQFTDTEIIFNLLQKNILMIEQKINFIFKEVTLIIDNFRCSVINFSGFKKLNGSQLVKENITYLLNSLKAKINEIEKDKTILHIFNSNYLLDKKNVDNLPIGLFGNFYSHELSFFLINNNDFKNLKNIFSKCNLKIKKIISKNFIEGANLNKCACTPSLRPFSNSLEITVPSASLDVNFPNSLAISFSSSVSSLYLESLLI